MDNPQFRDAESGGYREHTLQSLAELLRAPEHRYQPDAPQESDYRELRQVALELVNPLTAPDGSLQQEVAVNGMRIPREGRKAYKEVVIHMVIAKLQDGMPPSVEPMQQVVQRQ